MINHAHGCITRDKDPCPCRILLHLGCGATILSGWVNLDSRPLPGVQIVRDILRGLPFSDSTVDQVYSENFLEHLPQGECIWVMNEIHRVLKPGGTAHHLIPMAGTVIYFQDPTHLSHWHPETFTYFTRGHYRNLYYGGDIKPWVIESLILTDPNRLIDVVMRKPE